MSKVENLENQEIETIEKMPFVGNLDNQQKEEIEKMPFVGNLDNQQKEEIEKLRMRFKDVLPRELYEDSHLFYRFLKARDFNINKAEYMLKQNIIWRKAHQMDTISEDFKPLPVFMKYVQGTYLGEDKNGCAIRYQPLGDSHIRDIMSSFKINNLVKHWMYTFENDLVHIKELNQKSSKNTVKYTLIANLDKLQFTNAAHPSSAAVIIRIASFFQDNYPETLNAAYLINAPAYYAIAYSIIKRFLAPEVIRKIRVYGKTGWKKDLLEVIDPEVLPAFLGGKRTDPDGNQMCNTFMCHGGRIPSEYFLSKEDRTFKDMTNAHHITVSPRNRYEVFVEVEECGSVIHWEFKVESKDIGFGLYLKGLVKELKEILPICRYETQDGTEIGSYRCQLPGIYVIIFDNTFSWINTKEVSYHITVTKPQG